MIMLFMGKPCYTEAFEREQIKQTRLRVVWALNTILPIS